MNKKIYNTIKEREKAKKHNMSTLKFYTAQTCGYTVSDDANIFVLIMQEIEEL